MQELEAQVWGVRVGQMTVDHESRVYAAWDALLHMQVAAQASELRDAQSASYRSSSDAEAARHQAELKVIQNRHSPTHSYMQKRQTLLRCRPQTATVCVLCLCKAPCACVLVRAAH